MKALSAAGPKAPRTQIPRRIQGLMRRDPSGSSRTSESAARFERPAARRPLRQGAQSMRFEAKTVIRTQTWTTERIALLKNLMDAGLSCGQIAREIGVSRNAVIGKANRLGLSRFEKRVDRAPGQTGTRKNRNIAAKHRTLRALWAKPQVAPAEADDSISRCSLMELREWHCRWPCGDPNSKDFGFCGNPPVDGLPYCSAHARIAYRPGTRAVVRQLRCFA